MIGSKEGVKGSIKYDPLVSKISKSLKTQKNVL
jgi:hypothetical protein